jgi:hypothetical protein
MRQGYQLRSARFGRQAFGLPVDLLGKMNFQLASAFAASISIRTCWWEAIATSVLWS